MTAISQTGSVLLHDMLNHIPADAGALLLHLTKGKFSREGVQDTQDLFRLLASRCGCLFKSGLEFRINALQDKQQIVDIRPGGGHPADRFPALARFRPDPDDQQHPGQSVQPDRYRRMVIRHLHCHPCFAYDSLLSAHLRIFPLLMTRKHRPRPRPLAPGDEVERVWIPMKN